MTMRMMTKKKKKPVPKGQEGTPRPVWVPPYQWKCLHCFQMALWVRNLSIFTTSLCCVIFAFILYRPDHVSFGQSRNRFVIK